MVVIIVVPPAAGVVGGAGGTSNRYCKPAVLPTLLPALPGGTGDIAFCRSNDGDDRDAVDDDADKGCCCCCGC